MQHPLSRIPLWSCGPLALLALCFNTVAAPAQVAAVLTGGGIITAARVLVTELQNLASSVTGDAMTATNNAATQVDAQTTKLEQALHGQVNIPLTNLSSDVRNSALLLNSTVADINALITRQRACLFTQLDLFVAGLNTNVRRLVDNLPILSGGSPTITSFRFAGKNTDNIVPASGGSATVKGFNLWPDPSLQPRVTLWNVDHTVELSALTPSRGANNDEIVVHLPGASVAQFTGQCLSLHIEPVAKWHGVPWTRHMVTELNYPICVPKEYGMMFRLKAWVAYDVPSVQRYGLDPWQNFRFDNPECEHHHAVSMSKSWTLPADFHIVSIQTRRAEVRNDNNNIGFSQNAGTITAAGDQDSPTCVTTPFSQTLIHTAIWSFDARPEIEGTTYAQRTDSGSTDGLDVVIPTTQLCAALAKIANVSGRDNIVWYQITPIIGGKEGKPFVSARVTTTTPVTAPSASFGDYQLNMTFNPTPVSGQCQVCVSATATGQCAY